MIAAVPAINRRTLLTTLAAAALYRGSAFAQAPGPLSSWSDRTRQPIMDFVDRVTREGGPDYVAPAERIATFDNDGTLWCEKPLPVQGAFALDRIKAMAPQHPEWKDTQPFKAVLEGNPEALLEFGENSVSTAGGARSRSCGDRPQPAQSFTCRFISTSRTAERPAAASRMSASFGAL
jgi:hypothetical protein